MYFFYLILLVFTPLVFGATTNSITQWGITFSFNSEVTNGQFANGDYWVLAPVTITNMTPAWDGAENGWEINPTVTNKQGFLTNSQYLASLRPEMPFTITTNASLVKVVSGVSIDTSTVNTAAVLTVIASLPELDCTNYFRPPYVGTNKPLYLVSSLQSNLLPTYASVSNAITLSSVVSNFSKCLRMDHNSTLPRWYRPTSAMWGYQPSNTKIINDAMLRLMLDDSYSDKLPALIQFTQYALDRAYAVYYGYRRVDDGHNPNHRLLAIWAAVMLDITTIKNYLTNAVDFHEDYYLSPGINTVLWGNYNGGFDYVQTWYWNWIMIADGDKSTVDPYGYIDGGSLTTNGSSYQIITSQPFKGQALVYKLFPTLTNYIPTAKLTNLTVYAERWVTNGVWASPDPAAPYDGNGTNNYGITFGPDGNGSYIPGSGRYTQFHGAGADSGQNKSEFVASMWNNYFYGTNTIVRNGSANTIRANTMRVFGP